MDAAEAWLRRAEGIDSTRIFENNGNNDRSNDCHLASETINARWSFFIRLWRRGRVLLMRAQVLRRYTVSSQSWVLRHYLVEAQETHGQLRGAIETCQRGLSLVQDKALEAPWSSMVGFLHVRLARILCERNELEECDSAHHGSQRNSPAFRQ